MFVVTDETSVGVLANPIVASWQEAALENVAALDGVGVEHVVVDASVRAESSTLKAGADGVNRGRSLSVADLELFFDVYDDVGLKAFLYADRKLGWMLFDETAQMKHLQSTPVEDVEVLSDATFHECDPVPAGGAWNALPADVTETLGDDCDVVFRFGFGLLKGDVLDAPDNGVWSTHGSDIREYRGMGPKITFLGDDDHASVTLQRLTEDIDGGRVVEISSRDLSEKPTMADVLDAVYELQSEVFATGVEKLRDDSFEPRELDELGEYHSHDKQEKDPRFVASLVAKNNLRRLRRTLVG